MNISVKVEGLDGVMSRLRQTTNIENALLRGGEIVRAEAQANDETVSYRFIDERTVETAVDNSESGTSENGSAIPYSDKEKQNWENSKDIIVYESDEQFETFVEKVLKNEDTHKIYTLVKFLMKLHKWYLIKQVLMY